MLFKLMTQQPHGSNPSIFGESSGLSRGGSSQPPSQSTFNKAQGCCMEAEICMPIHANTVEHMIKKQFKADLL